jgi:hypothetical protein
MLQLGWSTPKHPSSSRGGQKKFIFIFIFIHSFIHSFIQSPTEFPWNNSLTGRIPTAMPPLSDHPIFKISPEDISTQPDPSALLSKNILTFKHTEIYLAVGSTVRYADLRDWYVQDHASPDGPHYQVLPLSRECAYKTLRFPTVGFDIRSLVWNSRATQLALVGARDVAVVQFPRLGLTGIFNAEKLPPK